MNVIKNPKNNFEIIVVGCGLAGLYTAIKASEFARVCLITKGTLNASNSYRAQGGIACAVGSKDSCHQHKLDTLNAGGELCDRNAVTLMTNEAKSHINTLMGWGFEFDMQGNDFALSHEGAHTNPRVIHAGGDATGRKLIEHLSKIICENKSITLLENTFVSDLLFDNDIVLGVKTLKGEIYCSNAVVLATGGVGQLFSRTTNSESATGDGLALAERVGAEIIDMEFIQFHPTAFSNKSCSEVYLATEALRGRGAALLNSRGERFMRKYNALQELAPRDIVSRAIMEEMRSTKGYVFLDATKMESNILTENFPTVFSLASKAGYDLRKDYLPVFPAAHYLMGGIKTNMDGFTGIEGLYACGETACTRVHGANRLASNSLLECLVFANRLVSKIEKTAFGSLKSVKIVNPIDVKLKRLPNIKALRSLLQHHMFEYAGILRDEKGLLILDAFLTKNKFVNDLKSCDVSTAELQNLFLCAKMVLEAAKRRKASCGAHWRVDDVGLKLNRKFKEDMRNEQIAL